MTIRSTSAQNQTQIFLAVSRFHGWHLWCVLAIKSLWSWMIFGKYPWIKTTLYLHHWISRNLKEDDQSAVIGDIFQKAWDHEAKKTKKYVWYIKHNTYQPETNRQLFLVHHCFECSSRQLVVLSFLLLWVFSSLNTLQITECLSWIITSSSKVFKTSFSLPNLCCWAN